MLRTYMDLIKHCQAGFSTPFFPDLQLTLAQLIVSKEHVEQAVPWNLWALNWIKSGISNRPYNATGSDQAVLSMNLPSFEEQWLEEDDGLENSAAQMTDILTERNLILQHSFNPWNAYFAATFAHDQQFPWRDTATEYSYTDPQAHLQRKFSRYWKFQYRMLRLRTPGW